VASTPVVSPAGTLSAAPTGNGATQGTRIDWKALDACSLIDSPTVHELTGESVRFVSEGHRDVSGSKCFWGAAVPGVPAYVEITFVNGYAGGLSAVGFTVNGTRCTADIPVAGVGIEARGGSCTASSQRKVYLYALFQGGAGQLLVNASKRPLEPSDLAATVNAALLQVK
jgi:hypothetical protein